MGDLGIMDMLCARQMGVKSARYLGGSWDRMFGAVRIRVKRMSTLSMLGVCTVYACVHLDCWRRVVCVYVSTLSAVCIHMYTHANKDWDIAITHV